MTAFSHPELLVPDHELDAFDCGSAAQTDWLRTRALQAQRSDTCRVYIVCQPGTRTVLGYYALAAGSIEPEAAPPRVATGAGRYPIPVVLLARLGVDTAAQGQGLGTSLVRDALLQVAAIADRIGVRALVIHAETADAADFYRRISPSFEASPTDPLDLIFLTKDLRRAIREAATTEAAPTVSR